MSEGTRTPDVLIHSRPSEGTDDAPNPSKIQRLSVFPDPAAAPLTAGLTGAGSASCRDLSPDDPDLARLVDAWPDLPPHIRLALLALVQAAGK